ncbi:unnamed protein product [Symbiodinium sp. CCMP2592]|nr:unnamed protein product [Symbiodinium sp. CCMP2592]
MVPESTVEELRLRAQTALSTKGRLRTESGAEIEGEMTLSLSQAGLQTGDRLTLYARPLQVAATQHAFAAIEGDGSVVTWGNPEFGGDCSGVQEKLRNVLCIQATDATFAALLADGSVVAWGHDGKRCINKGSAVECIQSTKTAFAALHSNGSVDVWGVLTGAGALTHYRGVLCAFDNVSCVQSNGATFAALLRDGSVRAVGDMENGADIRDVQMRLQNVRHLQSTGTAFAAILETGLVKQGYTVVRNVFSEAECDAAVDKIWGFAEGRCPSLKAADESTWTAENWGAFARGKCLCQLLGAGWVLWEERLLFRRRLVERGIYADRPHHASWDGFTFGRPVTKLWRRSEWDHTDQVLIGGESTGCTWIQGVVALNALDPEVGAAFECWPGTQDDETFRELQQTAGLCDTPNGPFRPLLEAGRGWLQGKGFRRQRVPVGRGDVILWDSRLVHQGGAPLTPAGSRSQEPSGSGGRRTSVGRAAAYFSLGLREFTPEAVLKKRREAFQAGGVAVTLNHKAEGFEPFKKSRLGVDLRIDRPCKRGVEKSRCAVVREFHRRQRLERLLHASEELQLIAAAVLVSALGGEGRPHVLPVWLALGRPRTHCHHIIFVFTRPRWGSSESRFAMSVWG